MSKKNFGYTSISNIKRRLGTWDSRKPGQSPKEMKALLEGADNTLQGTKMKPESQGKRYYEPQYGSPEYDMESHLEARKGSIISSNKPESAKVRNPLTIHDRSTGGPRKGHGEYLRSKFYKSDVSQRTGIRSADSPSRTGVIGAEVTRNPSLRKSATDAVKDKVKIGSITKLMQDPDFASTHTFREPKKAPRLGSIDHPGLTNKQLLRMSGETAKKYAPEQVRRNVTYRTQGKQKLLSGGKASGMSYIFKEMKRRLMKGIPGTSSKTY